MKKRLMAVLLCVCMAAVLLTPYASVLTADGALRLGIAGAENGQDLTGESSSTSTEGGEEAESAETLKEEAPEATATAEPEATATTAPEATATTAPEATKAPAPKYTLDSNRAVYKDGATLRGEPKDCVVKASYSVALAYTDPTDRSEAKTYAAGDRVRVYDEIPYEDCDGAERKWSVVLDGSDFYFVLSEALESAPELPAQAPAQTDMKSLFGGGDNVDPARIINPGDTKVATYNFYNGTALVQSEIVKNGESLKEPAAPATVEGQTFDGWYTAAEGGEKFTSFGTALTVTETTTIKLYARFKEAYHIYFYTPKGEKRMFTEEVDSREPHDFSDLSYEVGANIKVTGWAATLGGNEDVSDRIVIPEGETSVSVYAIETKGYWVVFDTQGGTSVAPVFKAEGKALDLSTVTAPTRTGYEFKGWRDSAGNAVSTVDSATTLYATWEPKTANLTVIFWYENADDQYYGQAGSVQTPANTGATVTSAQYKDTPFDGRDNTHFTYNAAKAETVTVKGDGSTVLNVYYTRNTYTLTFRVWEGGLFIGSWKTVKTITAKYNAKISDEFNKAPFTTTYNGQAWESEEYGYALQTLDRMPGFNTTFDLYGQSTNTKKTITYYVQKIGTTVSPNAWPNNPDNFDLLKKVDTYFKFATYDEEYHEILGFTRYSASVAGFKNNRKDFSNNKLDLYYMRNNYKLRFYNHNGELTSEARDDVPYEAPLKSYADAVTAPYPFAEPGLYTFDGWYTNRLFEQRVDEVENDVKMPASELTLYARWVPKTFTVSFNLGYDNAPAAPADQTVEAKKKATQPADPTRDGYRFVGWYDGDKPFSFETEIVKDTALTAKWLLESSVITVQYKTNGGGGTAPTDDTPYADGAGAVVKDKTADMTHPDGKFFLGWATDKAATTAEYQPGGTMPIVADNAVNGVITLYAVWGDKPATTTLTYNANYGANPETKLHALELEDGTTITNLLNNTNVTLYGADKTFTREGYQLIGWAKTANATEPDYEPGDEVIVDTDTTAGLNILYAVWEQSTTTVTVTKQVTGNFADKTRSFNFTYSWKVGENGTATEPVTFTLTHGAKPFEIQNVPIGATLTITETDADLTNYTTSFTVNDVKVVENGRTHSFAVSATGDTVVVTNDYNVVPDTGVILDSLPYVLILAVVALGAAGVVIRRRRSREDD